MAKIDEDKQKADQRRNIVGMTYGLMSSVVKLLPTKCSDDRRAVLTRSLDELSSMFEEMERGWEN